MSSHDSDPELQHDLKQPVCGVRTGAALSAAIHAFLWGCVALGAAYVVPYWAKVFQDFGVELSTIQAFIIDLSFLTMRFWPIGVVGLVVATVADWWFLQTLTTQSSRSLARFWFWANVALPILAGVGIGVIVSISTANIMRNLS
ncbi:MAG: hypothetical protein HON53_16715 [Planctomycetaceae bacterium]|jgi:hypothetical protein|nr:hypothetical protein [Planctomycetaceae bacterium]MBT6155381.1 hypothetical protein [Planctomycetaceae bacterium]MBT6487626.1 hypothetical protein [Planctomycetaceae bacterium]MBT6495897.1 hypothetical protein [Planctomycetaceae bacterium]